MIRGTRLFFKAVSLGFLIPALIVGAALYWASDRPPLPMPFAGPESIEAPPPSLAVSGNKDAAPIQPPPQSNGAPPAVAILTNSPGHISSTELAAKIQTELRRLGCLQDAVDGTWNKATSAGARSFVEDRQLGIPTDAPSSLLLLLLEADSSTRCIGLKPAAVSAEILTSTSGSVGTRPVDAAGSAVLAPAADTGGQPDASKPSPQPRRSSPGGPSQPSTFSGLSSSAP